MSTRKNGLFIIENKVIDQKEIQQFANFIWKEYQPRHIGARTHSFRSYVKCFERVSYEDDGIKIFNEDSEIYKERIKTIEIVAQCDKSIYIKLRLNHGQIKVDDNYTSDSDIEIGGDNFEKIHDIHARMIQQIKSLPEQNNFFINHDKLLSISIFILATISFGFCIDLFNTDTPNYTIYWRSAISSVGDFITYGLLASFVGGGIISFFYRSLIEKSREYWPNVELRIGPEHLRPEAKQRKYLIQFLLLVVMPTVLAIGYDIAKFILYIIKK